MACAEMDVYFPPPAPVCCVDTKETAYASVDAQRARSYSAGGAVPIIAFADVQVGRVTEAQRQQVRRRGCAVERRHW